MFGTRGDVDRRPDGRWFESHFGKNFSRRNFGNSVHPDLPVSFGWDGKSRWSLLSGVYARGSKRSHQSALECVTVVDSTSHSKLPRSASMWLKKLPCTDKGRRRRHCYKKENGWPHPPMAERETRPYSNTLGARRRQKKDGEAKEDMA